MIKTMQMEYLLAIAKHKNITKAAEELHISQPSLSNQIIGLEKELGIALLERKKKRIFLTEAGQAFANHAQKILIDTGLLENLMTDYANLNTGSLRIGALSIMGPLKIPNLISKVRDDFPKAKITILEDGSNNLHKAVKDNVLDVAFVILNGRPDQEVAAINLGQSGIYAVLNKKHKLCHAKSITFKQLGEENLIVSGDSFVLQKIILEAMANKNTLGNVVCKCNQIESCLALVNSGMGISFCSKEVAEYFPFPNVVIKPLQPFFNRHIYLIYRKNPTYYPLLQEFIKYAQTNFMVK